MIKRYPWLKLLKKSRPEPPLEPPLWLGNHSNGEYSTGKRRANV